MALAPPRAALRRARLRRAGDTALYVLHRAALRRAVRRAALRRAGDTALYVLHRAVGTHETEGVTTIHIFHVFTIYSTYNNLCLLHAALLGAAHKGLITGF